MSSSRVRGEDFIPAKPENDDHIVLGKSGSEWGATTYEKLKETLEDDGFAVGAGAVGPQGPEGPQGPAGADGVDGTDGDDGAAGPQGPAGPAGADGQDGATRADDRGHQEEGGGAEQGVPAHREQARASATKGGEEGGRGDG